MSRFLYSLVAFWVLPVCLFAMPARQGALQLMQPDGTELTAFLHGDAFFHYYTNADGEMLQRDANGFYQAVAMPTQEEMTARRNSNPRFIAKQQMIGGELNIAPRGVVILVNFSNLAFVTQAARIDSMLNGQNFKRSYMDYSSGSRNRITSSGSVRQYFHDNSCGQYNPVFDVVGPVTLEHEYAYYGSNNAQGNDQNPGKMIKEACELVDDQVDFTLYDNDKNGTVDFVYIIYAGYSEAEGAGEDYIWPHNYNLTYTGTNCRVDGKKVDAYACSNELMYSSGMNLHTGVGTFCHEFSHVLGLPDLYATNRETHKTLGSWDILDSGPYNNDGNTPPCYSAYERFYMGWLTPTLINTACDVELASLDGSNQAVMLTSTGKHNLKGAAPAPTTFYILENRQQKGWDAYIPGHGMLVTRIKYSPTMWYTNTVNCLETAMGVNLIEADGLTPTYGQSGYEGKQGDAYPKGSDSFTDIDVFQVTDITENGDIIYFKVNGGGERIVLAVDNTQQTGKPRTAKILRNGTILIEHDGRFYNLSGALYK